jgi:hypothetical protein
MATQLNLHHQPEETVREVDLDGHQMVIESQEDLAKLGHETILQGVKSLVLSLKSF